MEDIERLAAKLEPHSLANRESAKHREIRVPISLAPERIAAEIAV
jgi:hypothetical protein